MNTNIEKAMSLKSGKLFITCILWVCLLVAFITGCKTKTSSDQTEEQDVQLVSAPSFNADSAYNFVQKQVAFGPRVPNTAAHRQCGDFLSATLKKYGLSVTEQAFIATTYDGKKLNARNIIGSLNPKASKRILLAAHWDSRPFADEDSLHKTLPVPAANDGASGVAVLLEVARVVSNQQGLKDLGVDILLFDAEDWGNSDQSQDKYGGYCLGSQYWAANKHQPGYTAYFGILLDMVGAKGAVFPQEGYSVQMAESVVRDVWKIAGQLGYNNYFIDQQGSAITDDHVPVNEVARIPMIDIIHTLPNNLSHTFFDAWHTTRDTMDNIDPKTLKAVGQTLIQVLFQEGAPEAL